MYAILQPECRHRSTTETRTKMNDSAVADKPEIHYAWIIAITGTAVLFACLGLGRFSLGMLLPSMGVSLELTYSQMGFIGTGNFVGYMVSVILAGTLARAIGARWTITAGLVLVGCSMLLIGRSATFVEILALYIATGIGSGFANVPMMGLVSHWFHKTTRGRAAGIMLSGNGLAIVCTGLFVPWVNAVLGGEGWRTGWSTMGLVSLIIACIAARLLRNAPADKGLIPLGENQQPSAASPKGNIAKPSSYHSRPIIHLGCIYTFFGATYVVYATFIVTMMVNERGFGEGAAGTFWAIVGVLSIFSGPLFGWLSDRLGRKTGMMIVYTLFTIAYALVAADLPDAYLFASIGIFGLTVWSIPTIMSAAVGDYMGPERAVKAFGLVTLFFGAGQITGPAAAGYLADVSGTFSIAFWLCALLTAIAVGLTYFLRPPSKE